MSGSSPMSSFSLDRASSRGGSCGRCLPWVVARLRVPRSAGLPPCAGVANFSTLEYVCVVNMREEFELAFGALLGVAVRIYEREQHIRRVHV